MSSRPKLKPSHLTIIIGVAVAIVTAVSGIVAAIAQAHDDSPMTRAVFLNIASPIRAIFYTTLAIVFVAVAWLFSVRVQNWERGQPDDRRTTPKNIKRRLADFRAGVYMQTLLRDPAAGVMHSLIYFPFLILFAVTTVLEINHQLPVSMKF